MEKTETFNLPVPHQGRVTCPGCSEYAEAHIMVTQHGKVQEIRVHAEECENCGLRFDKQLLYSWEVE